MTRRIIAIVLFCLIGFAVCAQEREAPEVSVYSLGDQTFSISAGLTVPLFFLGIDGSIEPAAGHLRLGAVGSLRWGSFLNNELSIGVELGGMFAQTVLRRTIIILPVSSVVAYALRFYPFEVLMHATLGVDFMRLDNDLYVGPLVKPGASFYWNYSSEWSFGLRAEYWFVPELYFGASPPKAESTFGNFLTVTLSTLYHF